MIYAGTRGYIDKVAVSEVTRYEKELLAHMRGAKKDLLKTIREEKVLSDKSEEALKAALEDFTSKFA